MSAKCQKQTLTSRQGSHRAFAFCGLTNQLIEIKARGYCSGEGPWT
jgi:hypothetical protein